MVDSSSDHMCRAQDKARPGYATLPHQRHQERHQEAAKEASARTNVQKRRRRSHGLTIKIESPTTGEDSSAGIIDTGPGGVQTSPSNIYLSGDTPWPVLQAVTCAAMLPGVSISRGHSPPGLSSPSLGSAEGRQGRSPSLTMPPASPVARNSRVRSASLAVSSSGGHKTPPHSPGAGNLLRATQRQHQHFTLSTASRPLVFTAHFLRGSNREIFTLVHFLLLYITVCSTTTNNLN